MSDTASAGEGVDIDVLATKVVDQLAGKLASGKAVIVNQSYATGAPLQQDERKNNLARDALAAARSFGSDAIRFAFVFNGGALTAVLAYLGSGQAAGANIVLALVAFAAGAICAIGAALCAYGAQSDLADKYSSWDGNGAYPASRWRSGAVGLVCVCACLAAAGTVFSFQELRGGGKAPRTTLEVKITQK